LQAEGIEVTAFGRTSCDGPWDRFVQGDLSHPELPKEAFTGVSTVFHLAGKAHDFSSMPGDDAYRGIIVDGTRHLVDEARKSGIHRFILMSSVKAMGEGNPPGSKLQPLDEKMDPCPSSPYGRAKLEAEGIVRSAGFQHAVILRPVMVFGRGGKGNLERMREAVRTGRFPPVPENGNRRSMIHVNDLVEFTLRAAVLDSATAGTFILAHGEPVSTRQLYDAVRQSLNLKPVAWSTPLWSLKVLASVGSLLGSLLNRKLPLDRDTLDKLIGSAWYSSRSATTHLGYAPRIPVTQWLQSGMGD
jgi:nucleoside-diphosphate-sugar epimerase